MPTNKSSQQCPSYLACNDLRELLHLVGAPKENVDWNCPIGASWPCQGMVENARLLYSEISPQNSEQALHYISTLFATPEKMVSWNFEKLSKIPPFRCPELGIDIYQPCKVSSCTFHTDNHWTRNCILFYRLKQDRDVLNINELAFLLNRDVGSLRTQLNKAFRFLGQAALQETIERDYLDQQVELPKRSLFCGACGKKVGTGRKAVRKSGFVYCNRDCAQERPPAVLKVERIFAVPLEELLEICLHRFSSVRNMCAALGISQPIFWEWCQKYSVEVPESKFPT